MFKDYINSRIEGRDEFKKYYQTSFGIPTQYDTTLPILNKEKEITFLEKKGFDNKEEIEKINKFIEEG